MELYWSICSAAPRPVSSTPSPPAPSGPQGFASLRLNPNARGSTCFVEFDSVENASATHAALQGHQFASNDRGPVKLQFSKAPLNRKRDAAGQVVAGGGGGGGFLPIIQL